MAPVIEGFVRLRPDEDALERDLRATAARAEPTVRRSGESLGHTISDGFREGFLDGMPRTFRDANGRLRNERGAFVKEGQRLGDAASDGFHRGFTTRTRGLSRSFHGIGGGLGRSLGGGIVAGVGTYLGVGLFKSFVDEAREAGKQSRITANVIKVTGGAANVTAKDVNELANAISNKTAKDDEAIQSAANLLLTFKQVRNEAGKNNAIFDRGVQAAADLSVQFGGLDGAAKQMGKALNDPVKGVTALARAGVTFTQQQKDQIAQMVKNNNLLGAQKIILGEVESQVGGAAAAAADPLQRVGVVLDNVKETIGTELLPVVYDFSNWLSEEAPGAGERFAGWLRNTGLPAVRDFGSWLKDDLWPALQDVGHAIGEGIPHAVSNFKDAFKDTSGSTGDLGIEVGDLGDVITKVLLPGIEWLFETGLPAVGTALGETADLATTLGIAYGDLAVVGIEAFKDLFSASTAALDGTLQGMDKVRFLFPGISGAIHKAAGTFGDFRESTIEDMESAERHINSVTDALRAIKTDKAQQEFVSLREVANTQLDAIRDEDVSVQFNLFAKNFSGKKLPLGEGGAGHGHLAQTFSRHKWSDPGIGGGSRLNVREQIMGTAGVRGAMSSAYNQVAASAAGIGGRNIVNPYVVSARWMSYPGHTGIDLAGPVGSPVHAVGGGRVARALSLTSSYGKHVIVDHPGGWSTLYGHMSSLGVSAGDAVGGGSVVGLRGSTGNSTGPHTHFETRRYGAPVNPESVMAFDTGIGRLKPGWNQVYNGTGGDETLRRVTGAVTTQVFDRRTSAKAGELSIHVDGKAYTLDLDSLTRTARKAARETSTFAERLADSVQGQLDKTNARFDRQIERTRKKYADMVAAAEQQAADARTTLDSLTSAAESARQAGMQGVLGIVDPSMLGTDPVGHLQTWARDAESFVADLNTMAAKGLPPSLIQMIAAQGPVAGWDAAKAFANLDLSGASAASAAYQQIGAFATQAGKLTMDLAVPPELLASQQRQVAALEAHTVAVQAEGDRLVRGLERQQQKQTDLMQAVLDNLGTERVAILSKSGGEVLFRIVQDEQKKAARRG